MKKPGFKCAESVFCGAQELQAQRHCIPKDCRVVVTSIIGGLHHEYGLEKIAA
jgi:hypothetical protein